MSQTKVLVLTGYGINCEEETKFAFEKAGGRAEIVHINDLINRNNKLQDYNIMAFPGGFSFGDDTGSGNAMANRIKNHLGNQIHEFVENGNLIIGICNGFQVLANLGILPAFNKNEKEIALLHNDSATYIDRWVDLEFSGKSPWVKDIGTISMPIAHGEGKFFSPQTILHKINEKELIAAKYVEGEICKFQKLKANPNGSMQDIAAITDVSERVLGMMPHPERAIEFTQFPHWTFLKEKFKRERKTLPTTMGAFKIFENAVNYFK